MPTYINDKGVSNKTTALLKDAVLKAAETAGGGGPDGLVNYLVGQAKQNSGGCSSSVQQRLFDTSGSTRNSIPGS
ncbi:hypothetical protein Q3C01_18265 [Bradyrhizobium sp. UFLA05-109]